MFIGGVGSVLVILTVPLLDKLKIDDVVGAIPVHLVAGIWGTIAVVLSNSDATLGAQLYGIFAIGAFTIVTSAVAWYVIKLLMGVRSDEQSELDGLDKSENGLEAYPEFTS
jgi:Amt family ammonium transporter